MSTKFYSLQISDIKRETPSCVSVAFAIPASMATDFSFEAGQYFTFKKTIENQEIRRSYSLCSAPHENEWRVAIKQIPDGLFSSYANLELQVGDTLDVLAPMGNFKFSPVSNAQKNYALFAAGSGITPIFSILKTILVAEPQSTVTLFYGNKGQGEIIFREELEALKNKYLDKLNIVHVFSRENTGVPLLKGRIDTARIEKLLHAFFKGQTIDAAYLCGPQQMILAAKDQLEKFGLPAKQIHFELFHAEPIEKKEVAENPVDAFDSHIELIMDGEVTNFYLSSQGPSILDAAYQAGADAPFACKGGVCCTCKAKVLKGEVTMDINYALTPEEVEQGYVLTCQAHPNSKDVLISFDD
ncbi:MAG: 1,2-phenylacetyl-CoA epoxidase subunit PaaE [Flavobacteriales bacterium]